MVLVPVTDERRQEIWVSSSRVRVEQLRAELARRGLNTSGRKPELADRLNSVHADIENMQVVQATDQQEMEDVLDILSRLQSMFKDLQDENHDLQQQNRVLQERRPVRRPAWGRRPNLDYDNPGDLD